MLGRRLASPRDCAFSQGWGRSGALLTPESLNGVKARSLPSRVEAKDDADHPGKTDGHNESVGSDQGVPRGDCGNAIGADEPESKPQPAP